MQQREQPLPAEWVTMLEMIINLNQEMIYLTIVDESLHSTPSFWRSQLVKMNGRRCHQVYSEQLHTYQSWLYIVFLINTILKAST